MPNESLFRKEGVLYSFLTILMAILFSFFTLVFVISLALSFYIHNYNRTSAALLTAYSCMILSRFAYLYAHPIA